MVAEVPKGGGDTGGVLDVLVRLAELTWREIFKREHDYDLAEGERTARKEPAPCP